MYDDSYEGQSAPACCQAPATIYCSGCTIDCPKYFAPLCYWGIFWHLVLWLQRAKKFQNKFQQNLAHCIFPNDTICQKIVKFLKNFNFSIIKMASRNTWNTCIQMFFKTINRGGFFIYLAILALFWFWGLMLFIEMNFQFFYEKVIVWWFYKD